MHKLAITWIEFAGKVFIVVFAVYLMMTAMFMKDYRKIAGLIEDLNKTVHEHERMMISQNPEVYYQMVLRDEQSGNLEDAAKKLVMVINLAEKNNNRYKQKLRDLAAKGAIK